MLSLRVRCPGPKCQVTLHVPEQLCGQIVRCARCGQSFAVPPMVAPRLRLSRTDESDPKPKRLAS